MHIGTNRPHTKTFQTRRWGLVGMPVFQIGKLDIHVTAEKCLVGPKTKQVELPVGTVFLPSWDPGDQPKRYYKVYDNIHSAMRAIANIILGEQMMFGTELEASSHYALIFGQTLAPETVERVKTRAVKRTAKESAIIRSVSAWHQAMWLKREACRLNVTIIYDMATRLLAGQLVPSQRVVSAGRGLLAELNCRPFTEVAVELSKLFDELESCGEDNPAQTKSVLKRIAAECLLVAQDADMEEIDACFSQIQTLLKRPRIAESVPSMALRLMVSSQTLLGLARARYRWGAKERAQFSLAASQLKKVYAALRRGDYRFARAFLCSVRKIVRSLIAY